MKTIVFSFIFTISSFFAYAESPEEMFATARNLSHNGNLEKALPLFEKTCEAGIAEACLNAGVAYDIGIGVPHNTEKSLHYYLLGCKLNSGQSCLNGATIYTLGTHSNDLKADHKKAFELNEKACNLNVGMGCRSLALAYETGLEAEKSIDKALSYYEKGCKLNAKLACDDYKRLKEKNK